MLTRLNVARWICLLAGISITIGTNCQANSDIHFAPQNALQKPVNYREWIYLGTALTPNDLNDGKANFPEFHNVYMNPKAWRGWKTTGSFADKTVIVKELLSVGDHQAISGKGYFQGDFSVIAVAVKDRKRFANEPGNWGYFVFDKSSDANTTTQPKETKSCATCHVKHAATDLIFTQYYPVLRAAAPIK